MKRILLSGSIVILLMFFSNLGYAQVAKFQALYVYNICRYVEWPGGFGGSNFEIGIVGYNAEFKNELQAIAGNKTIQNKKIVIKQLNSSSESGACHVLFFSKGSEKQIGDYISVAKSALVVSEASGALDKGSGINFFLESSKLKFELKKANIENKGLVINNDLLKLAAKTF